MITITGVDKFVSVQTSRLTKLPGSVSRVVTKATRNTGVQAKRVAPVRTGYLRSQISAELYKTNTLTYGIVHGDAYNKNFNYGYAQENGTRRIVPKLFVYQSFEINKPIFIKEMKEVLKNVD